MKLEPYISPELDRFADGFYYYKVLCCY